MKKIRLEGPLKTDLSALNRDEQTFVTTQGIVYRYTYSLGGKTAVLFDHRPHEGYCDTPAWAVIVIDSRGLTAHLYPWKQTDFPIYYLEDVCFSELIDLDVEVETNTSFWSATQTYSYLNERDFVWKDTLWWMALTDYQHKLVLLETPSVYGEMGYHDAGVPAPKVTKVVLAEGTDFFDIY